ncbi:C39 family peptidase [Methanolobus sp. WCC5]|uniref:C39 family peptidase n=1 Tax=Methanolobus sp. WCC5 TaxID=3125785 RepID=UPI00324B15B8
MNGSGGPEISRRNVIPLATKTLALIACAMIIFTFNVASTEEALSTKTSINGYTDIDQDPVKSKILSVPYYNQGDTSWCIYYSLSMMLNYNNIRIQPWEIASHFNSGHHETFKEQYNIFDHSLEKYIKQSGPLNIRRTIWGFNVRDFDTENFNGLIKDNIDRGQPILMAFQYEGTDSKRQGHAIIAVGYDKEHIYLTDPSGAITEDLLQIKGRYVAVPVSWNDFNEKLVKNIKPSNMAFTIEILEDAPIKGSEGSIYMTDRSNYGFSCLSFTNRKDPFDIGLLQFDGRDENGYNIVKKHDISTAREPSPQDCMSVYFTVSNPTSVQKEYKVISSFINKYTGEALESFYYETDISIAPYNNVPKGINYSNQLENVPAGEYVIMLTLKNERMDIIDSITLDMKIY